jgi:SAM-dependent methyltransferase
MFAVNMGESGNSGKEIFLPGGSRQFKQLRDRFDFRGKRAAIFGAATGAAERFVNRGVAEATVFVETNEELVEARFALATVARVEVRLASFTATTLEDGAFDVAYAQASIGDDRREEILKEIRRLLGDDGVLSVGDVVALREDAPPFVADLWKRAGLRPLPHNGFVTFFAERGFEKIDVDFSGDGLANYYRRSRVQLAEFRKTADPDEAKSHKKLVARAKREADAFLDHGGDKFATFASGVFKKSS